MKNLVHLYNYLIILIAAFPLIGMRIEVYAIGLMCLFAIVIIIKKKTYKVIVKDWKPVLILSSYYLMAIVSFFVLSDDVRSALNDLETKASFIIFPLFIYVCKDFVYSETIKRSFVSFITSNVILAIYVWILIFNEGVFEMLRLDTHYNPVFRNMFNDATDIHLPYLGLLFGFSCIIISHFLVSFRLVFFKRILLITIIIFLLFSMAIFSARMAIFSSVIAAFYYIMNVVNKRVTIIIIGVVLLTIAILSLLPPIQRRIEEVTKSELVLPNKNQKSDKVNFRYGIYYCSKEVLKNNWLLGVGLGDVQKELNECYNVFDYESYYDDFTVKQYNSHNQYLNEWMTYGVFGLGLFIYFILFCFKNGTILHKSFLILILLGLLSENLFEREIGVVLFTFFNTLFFVLKRTDKKEFNLTL